MNSDLEEIRKLVSPPKKPVGLDRQWSEVEAELGISLPDDYKQFVNLYGSGVISDTIFVWNFRDKSAFGDPLPDILRGKGSVIALYEHVRSMGHNWPYTFYPHSGGLFPFVTINDVHHLNWLTSDTPDKWDVVYWFSDGLEFIHLKGDGFSRFLLKALRKEYTASELSAIDPPHTFQQSIRR